MGIKLAALESLLRRGRQKLHNELAGLRSQLDMI
jgi:DNA-directed RNA polymerase specialized sigma24 family protein